jgi:hypothetical protein
MKSKKTPIARPPSVSASCQQDDQVVRAVRTAGLAKTLARCR